MDTIGERLREERMRLDMNQDDFASTGGVGKRALINYEKGERSPDAAFLAAIAAAGVDVLYVLTGRYAGGVKPAPTLDPEEATMLEYFRAASPAVRRAAMGALLGGATQSLGGMTQTFHGNVTGQVAGRDLTTQQPPKGRSKGR